MAAAAMIKILDSSAVISFFQNEVGANIVENILLDKQNQCFIHAINSCEVYYDAIRRIDEIYAEKIIGDLVTAGVEIQEDFDQSFWKEVGRLKARYRASLADFCGIVLTLRVGGTFITADHHELDKLASDGVCPIQFIR